MSKYALYLLVFLGSGLGGVVRLALSLVWPEGPYAYAWATLGINVGGCLLIGLGAQYLMQMQSPVQKAASQAFLLTGFCGGLTTVSLFSRQSLAFWENGDVLAGALYIFAHLLFCPLATFIGSHSTKAMQKG